MSTDERRAEIAAGVDAVRRRIAAACEGAGRDPGEVTLTVVTKLFPATDVRVLAELGITDVGENRHQEASAKAAECADLPLRWHFVGGLQSNKAAAVASYSDVVESLDRAKLVTALARGAADRTQPLDCLVQVSLDQPGAGEGRSGAEPDVVPDLAARIAAEDDLRLRGLMAVAPLGEDPVAAFARMARIREGLLRDHPDATWLSAGMSGDLEVAIRNGATHVRVGSAVLGTRPAVK